MLANKSKVLLVSAILGFLYAIYLGLSFFIEELVFELNVEFLENIFITEFMIPHVILAVLALIFTLLAFFLGQRVLAVLAGVCYIGAAAVFLQYGIFVLPMVVLSFVGTFTLGNNKASITEGHDLRWGANDMNDIENTTWQDEGDGNGRFRGRVFGGFHREDVLKHMQFLYTEKESLSDENQNLKRQVQELENLLQAVEVTNKQEEKNQENENFMYQNPTPPSTPVVETEAEVEELGVTLTETLLPKQMDESAFGAPPTWSLTEEVEEKPVEPVAKIKPNLANPYAKQGVQKVKVRKA